MSKSGSVFLSVELDRAMVGGQLRFTECIEITQDWMPAIRNTATQKRWGARLALPAEVSCKELYERPLPVMRVPPATTCPPPPPEPTRHRHRNQAVCPRHPFPRFPFRGWGRAPFPRFRSGAEPRFPVSGLM